MREPDLRPISQLQLRVPRPQVIEAYERINELRLRLEQRNPLAELKRDRRRIVRVGLKALESNDPTELRHAIGTILTIANQRLQTGAPMLNTQYGTRHLPADLSRVATRCGKDSSKNVEVWVDLPEDSEDGEPCRRCYQLEAPQVH